MDGDGIKRENKLGGMRSVASAPDFSQLKRMHDTKNIFDHTRPKTHKRSLAEVSKTDKICSDKVTRILYYTTFILLFKSIS